MKAKELYRMPKDYVTRRNDTEYGLLETFEYESTTTGTTRKANIILPAGYDESKQYPILYLLHGIGGDHNEWLGADPVTVVGNLIADDEASEMIVVMPNVRARANDVGNPSDIYSVEHFQAFDNFINELQTDLMPYMEKNYAVKTGRENTAIAGLSMGGREALYIGLTMADTFGYVGAFCPAPGVLPYDVEPGLFEKEEFVPAGGYEPFIMIAEGDSDNVVSSWPSTYHKTLEENGVTHTYYITEGGHDFKVWTNGLYNFAERIFKTRDEKGMGMKDIDPNKPVVALTFDDGPNCTTTCEVLDKLEQYGVTATFFLIGDNITPQTETVVKRTYDMGNEIANHSKSHPDMTKLSEEEIRNEVTSVSEQIEAITGETPKFFRPPYILVNDNMYGNIDLTFICGAGCEDWVEDVSAKQRAKTTLDQVADGMIILLHDFEGNSKTVEALDEIIPGLQERGYQFVTVSQLFEIKNVEINGKDKNLYTCLE